MFHNFFLLYICLNEKVTFCNFFVYICIHFCQKKYVSQTGLHKKYIMIHILFGEKVFTFFGQKSNLLLVCKKLFKK